jgi:hypothetical protein
MLLVKGYTPLTLPSYINPLFFPIRVYYSLLETIWFPEKRMAFDLSFLYVA